MNANTEAAGSNAIDWLKWLVVFALVGGGIYGNWYFGDESLLLRVGALLIVAVVAALIAVQTERGRTTWSLIKESRSEIRRVVWPSNQETTQTTLVVLLMVVIFGLILWGLDSLFGYIVSSIIG